MKRSIGSIGLAAIVVLTSLAVPGPATAQAPSDDECPIDAPGVIVGTSGDDVLVGTNADDVICGLGGNDTIDGGNGNDTVFGGPGNDTIEGGNANDRLFGGPGDDTIIESNGNDFIDAGDGNNVVKDSNGNDHIIAGAGDDIVTDSNGNDFIHAGDGNDEVKDSNGHDIIDAGDGVNVVESGNGNDIVLSGSGPDYINTDDGNDYVSTLGGDDTVKAGNGNDIVTVGAGDDTVETGNGNDWVASGPGNDDIKVSNGNDTVLSGAGNDSIETTNGRDTVDSGSGSDTVSAGNGNDELLAGPGVDVVDAGSGLDVCVDAEDSTGCERDTRDVPTCQIAPSRPLPAVADLEAAALAGAPSSGIDARVAALTLLSESGDACIDGLLSDLGATLDLIEGDFYVDVAPFAIDRAGVESAESSADASGGDAFAVVAQLLALSNRVAALRALETLTSTGPAGADFVKTGWAARLLDAGDHLYTDGSYSAAIGTYERSWTAAAETIELVLDATDPDRDLLDTTLEADIGTDPNNPDTDGDGISDFTEFYLTGSDPLVADSDLDSDADGLAEIDELTEGTSPLAPDTDADGLLDGDEIARGTDPLVVDTDGDGLSDGDEVALGTNPLLPDTDDDGTPDGQERYETTSSTTLNESISVLLSASGDRTDAVNIYDRSNEPFFAGMPGLVSPVVDLTTSEPFDTATVTLPLDLAAIPDARYDELAAFFFDEDLELFVPVDGSQLTVDPMTSTVTFTTDHFTVFGVFFVPEWNAVFAGFDPDPRGDGSEEFDFIDVAIAIDSSGSMSWNDPANIRLDAARNFIDALIDGDRVSVIDFDSTTRFVPGLSDDRESAKDFVSTIDSSGGTNIGLAVKAINDQLITFGADDRPKFAILLTDGSGSYSSFETNRAAAAGIRIYTIGLGSNVNQAQLEQLANATEGEYFQVTDADDLPEVFSRIPVQGSEDSDGDGLSDALETTGVIGGNGKLVTSDPGVPNSDTDTLIDSEELVESILQLGAVEVVYYKAKSDPRLKDTDGDGLDDAEERAAGTNAWRTDSDSDWIDDATELEVGLDPLEYERFQPSPAWVQRERVREFTLYRDPGFLRYAELVRDQCELEVTFGGESFITCQSLTLTQVADRLDANCASGSALAQEICKDVYLGFAELTGLAIDTSIAVGEGSIAVVEFAFGDEIACATDLDVTGCAIAGVGLIPFGRLGRLLRFADDVADTSADVVTKGDDLVENAANAGRADEATEFVEDTRSVIDQNKLNGDNFRDAIANADGVPLNRNEVPGIEVRLQSDSGVRNIDIVKRFDEIDEAGNTVEKLRGIETKTGLVDKSKRIVRQLQKDAELLVDGQLDEIVWTFGCSPTTGRSGPNGPLREFLSEYAEYLDTFGLGDAFSVVEIPCP